MNYTKVHQMLKILILIFGSTLSISSPSFAMDKEGRITDCTSCHTLSQAEATLLLKPLNVVVKNVQHSPLRGLFEVSAEREGKTGLIFVDYGKKYVMQGVIAKIDEMKTSDQEKRPDIKEADKVEVTRMLRMNSIVMGNPNASKEIFVFTDPDCPFCSKMHAELQKLIADMDIAVFVKLYPLPIHPDAYSKAQVIMGRNSLELLNRAFSGEPIPSPSDSDKREAVDDTIELARSLGIKGTPAILLPGGNIVVGYKDAATLKKLITSGS